MKISIVYASMTGNTEKLAWAVEESVPRAKCCYFGRPTEKAKEADLVFAGFWTDRGNCDRAMGEYLASLSGKKIFLFGTAGLGGEPEYFNRILRNVRQYAEPDNQIIGSYMCQGKMEMAVLKRYESMREKDPQNPRILQMMDHFHKARVHPDAADLKRLQNKVRQIVAAYE